MATESLVEKKLSRQDGDEEQETRHTYAVCKSVKWYSEKVQTQWQTADASQTRECASMEMSEAERMPIVLEVPRKGDVISNLVIEMKTCGIANCVTNVDLLSPNDPRPVLLTRGSISRVLYTDEVAEITAPQVINKIRASCGSRIDVEDGSIAVIADAVGCKYDRNNIHTNTALRRMDPALIKVLADDEACRYTPYIADSSRSAYACSKRESPFQTSKLVVLLGSKNVAQVYSPDLLYCILAAAESTMATEGRVFREMAPPFKRFLKENYHDHVYQSRFSELFELPIPMQMFANVESTLSGHGVETGWKHLSTTFHALMFQIHPAKPQLSCSSYRNYGTGRMKNVAYCGLFLKSSSKDKPIEELTIEDLSRDTNGAICPAILPCNTVVLPSTQFSNSHSDIDNILWTRALGISSTCIKRTQTKTYGMRGGGDPPIALYSNMHTTSFRLSGEANYLPPKEAEMFTDKQLEEACITYHTNQSILCAANASNNRIVNNRDTGAIDAVSACASRLTFDAQMDNISQRSRGTGHFNTMDSNSIYKQRVLEYQIDIQTEKCTRGLFVYTQHDALLCQSPKFGFCLPYEKRKLINYENAVSNSIVLWMPSMDIQMKPVFYKALSEDADSILALGVSLNKIPLCSSSESGLLPMSEFRQQSVATHAAFDHTYSSHITSISQSPLRGGTLYRSFGTPLNFSRLESASLHVALDGYVFLDMRAADDPPDGNAVSIPRTGTDTVFRRPAGDDDDQLVDANLSNSSITMAVVSACNNAQRCVYGPMGHAIASA